MVAAASDLASVPHAPHPLHAGDRTWSETNCYVDLWIELLAGLRLDPEVALPFVLSSGFDGVEWDFLKPPVEDLHAAFGLEVVELVVWRPLAEHCREHLALGRVLTVEMDAWWLPDTAGTTYRTRHEKTTVAVLGVDPHRRVLTYVHARGRHQAVGEDYDALLGGAGDLVPGLPPYVELVRLDGLDRNPERHRAAGLWLARRHLDRRSHDPVSGLADRVQSELHVLATSGVDYFHGWAFATLRQCGSAAALASDVCWWLADAVPPSKAALLHRAADTLGGAAETARALQLRLARLARGRPVDPSDLLGRLRSGWDTGLLLLDQAVPAADELAEPGAARG